MNKKSKNKIRLSFLLMATMLVVSGMEVKAQDWPQFLGPDRNSISPQKGLLRSWPEKWPEVLWSVNIGIGYGGPVVKNGRVYLLDRDDAMLRPSDRQRTLEIQLRCSRNLSVPRITKRADCR